MIDLTPYTQTLAGAVMLAVAQRIVTQATTGHLDQARCDYQQHTLVLSAAERQVFDTAITRYAMEAHHA